MARLRICLLGSFQVSIDEMPITNFESNKVRALLAYMAVESRQAHRREKLAALFWPEMPPKRASSNLSQAFYDLRKRIHDHQSEIPFLQPSHETIRFNPDSDHWLDVSVFTGQLDEFGEGDLTQRTDGVGLEPLKAAVDLYRGDFLEGLTFDSSLAFDEWVMILRQRLQRRMLTGLHLLTEICAKQGKFKEALPFAWRQVELDPLGEPAYRQLMRLLVDSGHRSQALAQFERLQVILAEELNVIPELETLKLRDQIRGETSLPVQPSERFDNIPVQLIPLIGRQQELAELQEQIEDPSCRLLTILGPGGSGKTRLALGVAQSNRGNFTHGVTFVPLNPVQSPDSIIPAIVNALDLPRGEQDNHKAILINYLRNKVMLLVLDGFEHLLGGTGLLPEILRGAPGVKILVTSRTRLKIKSEHLFLLPGMSYPQDTTSEEEILGSDAVQLLINSLRQSRPGYHPPPDDIDFLLRICQQVEGMPLGITLAASWGATFSVEEIAERVSSSLDFLAADWDDVPTRQRSLRATFDHTWNLLGVEEQQIFQGLSVFRGAFTRKAAREVSGASSYDLRTLVERSLVWNKSPGWYEVHELLRQYGREKLAKSVKVEQDICDRHSVHYLNQLVRLGDELKSVRQESALSRINLEHENYLAAWNWSASHGNIPQIARGLDAICLYYDLTIRYHDGESACQTALEGLSQNLDDIYMWLLRARTLIWKSRFTRLSGNLEKAAQDLKAAHRLIRKTLALPDMVKEFGDSAREVEAFLAFECGAHCFQKDRAIAAAYFQDSLKHYQELDQPWWLMQVILKIAFCAEQRGDFKAAEKWLEHCFNDLMEYADRRSLADALEQKAYLQVRQGEVGPALKTMKGAMEVFHAIGDPLNIADGSKAFGMILGWHGRYQEAIRYLLQSLPIYQDLGSRYKIAFVNVLLGMMYALMGRCSEAKPWAKRSLSQGREYEFHRIEAASLLVLGWTSLGEGEFDQAAEFLQESANVYRQVKNKDELGWALAALGHAHLVNGDILGGLECIHESLQLGREIKATQSVNQALGPSAVWIGRQGDPIQAVELYSLACQAPAMGNSRWFGEVYGGPIAALAEGLPPEVIAAAKERGRARDIWQTAAELLEELNEAVS